MAHPPLRTVTILLIIGMVSFLFLNGMTSPKNKTLTPTRQSVSNKEQEVIRKDIVKLEDLHKSNDDNKLNVNAEASTVKESDPADDVNTNINKAESEESRTIKEKTDNKNVTDINKSDTLDIIPDGLKKTFPKPAPPLYLSLDNNALIPEQQLIENLAKPNVYFTWCGKQWFEFKHYLSVVSAIRAIQPDRFLFYYEQLPVVDSNSYNLWIDDLKHDFQFFQMIKMEKEFADVVCHGDRASRLKTISSALATSGGIYISKSTWTLEFPAVYRMQDVIMALNEEMEGYLMVKSGVVTADVLLSTILKDADAAEKAHDHSAKLKVSRLSCSHAHHAYLGVNSKCMIVNGGQFEKLYPMDYCYVENDPFAKIVRKLFYNTEEIRTPKPDPSSLVPNIGHMIWIGGGKMDFVFYLSLLSLLFVVKVDVVYIHGDQPPTGHYWAKINGLQHIRSRIKLIPRDPPTSVYQGPIEYWFRALMSDIIRVDLMIKYGGVYTDTDAIWVKPLSDEDRAYDAVATYDWVDWSYPYPDTVNFGVSYGKRNAPFYRLFRDSMRRLDNELHGFTGVAMPYKILEKHPGLLRIDRRLGVICYYSRCHPLWEKDYHNITHDHVIAGSIKNWREDVHAFHWTHPNPVELSNETMLMQSDGIFAEIGKYVLQRAGIL